MSKSNRRILIVDDNQAIHEDFRKILCPGQDGTQSLDATEAALFGDSGDERGGADFELDFACQGQEALTMVCRAWNEGRPYLMAFMDVRMPPGWDGIETTARIWEVDSYLQVVICTAYADYSWKQVAARLSQPDRFVILKKPFDVMEVLQMANAFTEKWHLLHEVEDRARKLRESEKRFQLLADATPGLVWTVGPDGKLDYASRRLQEFSGRTLEENKDTGWHQMVHPEDLPTCVERWIGANRDAKAFQMEYRLKRASDGAYRWHRARAMATRNGGGEIVHWVVTAIDIDDQKRAEAEGRHGLPASSADLKTGPDLKASS
jgi:PAS domain S-box-containing protein